MLELIILLDFEVKKMLIRAAFFSSLEAAYLAAILSSSLILGLQALLIQILLQLICWIPQIIMMRTQQWSHRLATYFGAPIGSSLLV